MKTYSLAQQIEEVERELALRANVYPGMIRSGAMRQSVADYHLGRMQAVLVTLRWLQANETDVRGFVAAKAEARTDPCPDCDGRGGFTALVDGTNYRGPMTIPCRKCGGSGRVKKGEAA